MAPSYILAVMGLTGAGKSSFVKLVTGDSHVRIGHSMASETKHITKYETVIYGRTFVLVDTPGFNDDTLKDSDVLKMLVDWLASTYRAGQKLSGILYLHRIDEVRMSKSSLRSLTMLKQLCGENFYNNLTLGTTCWSLVNFSTALAREGELEANSTFWKSMIAKGARLERIPDDVSKAQSFVYTIASHDGLPLKAQRDVVDLNISFCDLEVTKTVKSELELENLQKDQEARRKRLEEEQQEEFARAQHQQRLELEIACIEAQISRLQLYQRNRNRCLRKKPYGVCDNDGCWSRLKQWRYNWHCCSCRVGDDYWHCGPCGNICPDEEHGSMSQITTEDECVVM